MRLRLMRGEIKSHLTTGQFKFPKLCSGKINPGRTGPALSQVKHPGSTCGWICVTPSLAWPCLFLWRGNEEKDFASAAAASSRPCLPIMLLSASPSSGRSGGTGGEQLLQLRARAEGKAGLAEQGRDTGGHIQPGTRLLSSPRGFFLV